MMPKHKRQAPTDELLAAIATKVPVSGSTHNFYRYPACFSPFFVREIVCQYSSPGDVVLDPFMGGGTTIVEALSLGRNAIGLDINSLAHFVATVKTSRATLRTWYERHNAPYNVVTIVKRGAVAETMQVIDVVNDQPYCIRLEMEKCPFAAGQIVIGSLVPWRGEWYWSGGQQMWQKAETGSARIRFCAAAANRAEGIVADVMKRSTARNRALKWLGFW
jgi:DNA methylase